MFYYIFEKLENDIISKKDYLKVNHKYGTSNKLILYMLIILSLLGVFGSSKGQFLKMYNSGEMDQVLLDNCDSEKTEIVHNYFEDNVKVLSKKKDRN